MPEINGNDPTTRPDTYVNLVPCATPDETNPSVAHRYEATVMESGEVVRVLGWSTLGEARETYAEVPYAVRFGSHSICPTCIEIKFGSE